MPAPVGVDIAVIGRGPLEVTVDEEGVAEIRDVFRVSAPIAGKLNRIPVDVGDTVSTDGTAVAAIQPAEPSLLDVRTQRELQAAAEAARAAVGLAQAQVTSAEASERLAAVRSRPRQAARRQRRDLGAGAGEGGRPTSIRRRPRSSRPRPIWRCARASWPAPRRI